MKCENPMLAVKNGDKYVFVGAIKDSEFWLNHKYLYSTENKVILPCGQCFACRLNRARDWATRCILEAKMHDENCFITLTYDPKYFPENGSLVKKHFQLFMKRLRKALGDRKIRYYMCGEYGEKFGRPHFHAIIFGYMPKDLDLYKVSNGIELYKSAFLAKIWKKGFVSVGAVTYESCAYVARYIDKKLTGERGIEAYGEKIPPYTNMSLRPGIGAPFLERYGEDIYSKDFIVIRDGIKVKPPRYFDSIYDNFYGEGAFDSEIMPSRLERSEIRRNQNLEEYTYDSYTRQGRFQRVKHKHDRRDYCEEDV